ncbi:MAG: hypothetical protein HJHJAOHD_01379 [Flavobacteriales bacterium]|nr:hypothetical protein [Flavobacteriales bacterium]
MGRFEALNGRKMQTSVKNERRTWYAFHTIQQP